MTIESSEQVDAISAALVTVRPLLPVIPRGHTGKIQTKSGGEYSYSYADLADTRAACDPILAEHGLTVVQFPSFDGTTDLLVTRVVHSSGQWLQASMRLFLAQQTPQGMGSAISYARRYAYTSALGIVTDDDDDGASANVRKRQAPKQQAAPRSGGGSCAACGGTKVRKMASGSEVPCPVCAGKEANAAGSDDTGTPNGERGASATPPASDVLRRQRAANATLNEAGYRSDDERHAAIHAATGGASSSSANLTPEQLVALRAYCAEHPAVSA